MLIFKKNSIVKFYGVNNFLALILDNERCINLDENIVINISDIKYVKYDIIGVQQSFC